MSRIFIAALSGLLLATSAYAQTARPPGAPVQQIQEATTKAATPAPARPAGDCDAKAIGKDGKPLAGAAKTAFVKKCEADSKGASATAACEAKAMGKDGKALAGAAKTAFMKKCEADGQVESATAACEAKAVGKDGKDLAGAAKSAFVKKCVADAKG